MISGSQYCLIAGLKAADSAMKLKKIVSAAIGKKQPYTENSLDIKNAFNSITGKIVLKMADANVPSYLFRIVRSSLDWRKIEVETSADTLRRPFTCGVPQGSVLVAVLWSLSFNGVFKVKLPPGVQRKCYADDKLVCCADTVAKGKSSMDKALEALIC